MVHISQSRLLRALDAAGAEVSLHADIDALKTSPHFAGGDAFVETSFSANFLNGLNVYLGDQPFVNIGGGNSIAILANDSLQNNPVLAVGENASPATQVNRLVVSPAKASTAAPAWTDGKYVPLSVDLAVILRMALFTPGGLAETAQTDNADAVSL